MAEEMLTSLERYERLADEFYRETGSMAPGKDMPAEMGSVESESARWAKWGEWLAHRGLLSPESGNG